MLSICGPGVTSVLTQQFCVTLFLLRPAPEYRSPARLAGATSGHFESPSLCLSCPSTDRHYS